MTTHTAWQPGSLPERLAGGADGLLAEARDWSGVRSMEEGEGARASGARAVG